METRFGDVGDPKCTDLFDVLRAERKVAFVFLLAI